MFQFTDFLCFSVTFLTILVLTKVLRKKSDGRRYPPSLPSLPLVGSLPFIRNFANIHKFFMSKADELGPIYTFRVGSSLSLTLNSRETIVEALVNNSVCFAGRASFYMERYTNKNEKGILARDYTDDFKRYHKLSLSLLKEFGFGTKPLMETRILEEFKALESFIRAKEGKEFYPREIVHLCTYNVVKNILFGKRADYEKRSDEMLELMDKFIKNTSFAIEVAPELLKLLPYFSRKLEICARCITRMCKIIEEEIESIRTNCTVECFVSSYLAKAGPDYDKEQLIYTARDLIAAGTETTATTLLWLMIFIANNPAIQERLQKDIDGVIARDRLPSLDDQKKLPFVEATILEMWRFRSVIPIAIPHLTLSDSNVCGYFIPAGTKVFPNLHAAHMDPRIWIHPNVFRPERFLDDDNNLIGKERVIIFSLGRRSCLGEMLARQEIFLFLAGLIQRFNIESGADGLKIDDTPVVGATLCPRPFKIRMIPREE